MERGGGGRFAVNSTLLLWMSCLGLLATALLNLGYRALRQFSRHDLAEVCTRRGKPERFGEILRQHEEVALGVEILTGFTAALGVIAGAAWVGARWNFWVAQSPTALFGLAAAVGL